MPSARQETMATCDKSPTPHTSVNHVELSTDPTGEGEKSESSFSKSTAAIEIGSAKSADEDEPLNTDTATEAAPASLSPITPPPAGPVGATAGAGADSPETKVRKKVKAAEAVEEKKESSPELPPSQDRRTELLDNDVVVPAGVSTTSMPATPLNTKQPMVGVEMQRSKSLGEVDTIVATTTTAASVPVPVAIAHVALIGNNDSSRITVGSLDEASELQDILCNQDGNNQIVERSPGERYVRFSEKLGSGASKDVYRAYDTEEGIEVAWNVVHLAGVPKNERNRIVNEVRLLERLHHQNIISFHGSWINREQQQVNFVTEILSSGTLKSFIKKVQVIRWKIAKRWAVQILKGLEYLHAQDPPVIHRDLKCENIFINGTSGDLRIGDLGLSTVHRNGKALSVLGTPEFMAPDMYEEGSYDEKVDIYAFGMCLLEIFTKEIPYKECNNPAQIYKKVMRGAPPDSLGRLKSTHARKFIELCLGSRNDDGTYERPSAPELLDHPFLVKREVDDEEVEVDPPLQEQTILEAGTRSSERSSTESKGANANANANANTSTNSSHSQNNLTPSTEPPPTIRHNMRQDSLEEEESDRFEEMPDSEVNNMKKVKVMMGRGEELKEDDIEAANDSKKRGATDANSSIEAGSISSLQNVQNNDMNGKKLHYLVAAAVIEESEQTNNFQQSQPYHDDILKLVITLPVEGQTQNVQFDFHLVEDDPIQVAKEMVAELGIPEEAVLEISETVSGLARVARTKKHKFSSAQAQQTPGHPSLMRNNSIASQPQQVGQTAIAQQQPQQHMGQGMIQPTNQQQPIQDYIPSQQQQLQSPPGQNIQQTMQQQQLQLQPPPGQNIQQPLQQQTLPLQDQSVAMHGQQIVENTPMPSQMQHMQSQRAQSGDAESHRQAQVPYVQAGMEMNSQMEPPNHNHQRQQTQMNGEYHHQGHVSSETKPHQPLAQYGQSSAPPSNPSMPTGTRSSTNSQNSHSQIPQQRPSQQSNQINNLGAHEAQPNVSGGAYPQAAPNQIQSQAVQYPPNRVQQVPGHVSQPGGSGQQAMPTNLQPPQHLQNQQIHGGSQGLGQGYTQHQQLQPSMQHAQNLPQQQQQPVQQIQNIPQQQHMQNVVQQQPPMIHQMTRQSSLQQQQQLQQPITNQQHQMQQGRSQRMDHHQQQQQPITQQHSSHTQNQQQHQSNSHMSGYQIPPNQGPPQGQRIATAANSINLPIPQDISNAGDFVPVAQQNEAPRLRNKDGSSSSTTDPSTTTNNRVRTTSLEQQQEDNIQGESMGVLEGLSIDTSGDDDEPTDEICAAELRKLDQDFQNNLKRAKKVYVNRMGNLQRTQVQREALHQKTLEQHQKDRTAFEKRLQQEEIEQNRRIVQMQKEWDRRRVEVRLKDQDE